MVSRVAVIGAACRFPGGSDTPEKFLDNLLSGQNYVSEIPLDRWSLDKFFNEHDVSGKAYVKYGHFLKGYDYRAFDADFFSFSPREVEFLDPQQRLLLELSWEAMEAAGLDAEALAGSNTGVFVGGFTVDHLLNQFGIGARDGIGSHSAAGATLTMLSNRISYAFDFHGPSFSLDTACSSSLVAFAQAVTAIATGQCEMALVGGANFILRPEYTIAMSKGRFLAKDGRSKSFDARADGYGRGEGGGIVVVKDYEAAVRDGDTILAVVDGAGVNQDGRTSGITVPNPEAQRRLMQQVLAQSGCSAETVDYVEAHGTGTAVGDPLETRAIADVYGQKGRCIVGSVKSSIGHLEAAAGIASVVKSVMMLRHNIIPPVAGLGEVNTAIPREVELPREPRQLTHGDAQGTIAINSFGYGGTNAHVILSAPPATAQPGERQASTATFRLLPLSARDDGALKQRARQMIGLLESADAAALDDILFTASRRRAHLDHRVALWGANATELVNELKAFLDGSDQTGWIAGAPPHAANARIAFVYTGMGPQWYAMGQQLFRDNQVFRATLETADGIFRKIAGFSILEEMARDEASSAIKRTEFAQPANLMVQIGLTAALRAEGVIPSAVVGHSVGEVASAWASGMLTLEEALLVSRERSRIQATTAGEGGMLALGLAPDKAAELIKPYKDVLSLAALNSPLSVTVAGDLRALDAVLADATDRGIFARKLDVAVPYHSPLMEKLKPELREKLAALAPCTPDIPLYSTVSGAQAGHASDARFFDAEYWCDNVREPVYFAQAIGAMLDDGHTLFVEVGPHPVLRRSLEEIFRDRNVEARIASTLWMNKPETPALRRAVGEIFVHGGALQWPVREPNGCLTQLPAYPWQRKSLWRETLCQERDRLEAQQAPLNARDGADLNLRRLNYLFDHVVDGAAIMPAAGFLEALCEEASRRWPATAGSGWSLRNVNIHEALILDHQRALKLAVQFNELTNQAELLVRNDASDQTPVLHADAYLYPCRFGQRARLDSALLGSAADAEKVDADTLYAALSEVSLQYGLAFQPIISLQRNKARGEALAVLTRPDSAGDTCADYILHPSLLDGCFQSALSLMDEQEGAFLPVSLAALEVYAPTCETILCHTRIVARDASRILCDFSLADQDGLVLARISGLKCVALRGKGKVESSPAGDYQRIWNPAPAVSATGSDASHILFIANMADRLADALEEVCTVHGISCSRYRTSEVRDAGSIGNATHVVDLAWAGRSHEMDPTGEDEIIDLLGITQLLASLDRKLAFRVITRGAAAVLDSDRVTPAQSAVTGFVRVARNEFTQLDAASIDVADEVDLFQQAQALLVEILNPEPVDEIALRAGQRYQAELVQSGILQQTQTVTVRNAWDAEIGLMKSGNRFSARVLPPAALTDDAYEIRVESFGLQLSQDSSAMGISGVITRTGSHTRRFAVGDRVCGIVPRAIVSVLKVRESDAVLERVPDALNDLPLSGLIATVEVHAALIAQACTLNVGARALVSAGVLGDALARHFEAAGVTVVRIGADLTQHGGADTDAGFDVIAAPLARWSREMGFFALAEGGQLVDLDAQDEIVALPARCGRLVRVRNEFDALRKAPRYAACLRAALAGVAEIPGKLAPVMTFAELPNTSVGTGTVGNDWMELRISNDDHPFDAMAAERPAFRADATYLVTGGFGGLGREVARWLARSGAGHVALVSRRGADTPLAQSLLEELRCLGAAASAYAVDMGDAASVRQLIRILEQSSARLKGVFHAAGVLDDQLLGAMNAGQVTRVMQPKAGGGWALHNALLEANAELDHFVLFSSIANLVGNSRQANYCAANGFLDGLAHLRRAMGLPALSINFGAIANVGMLEGDARVGQHLTQIGLTPLDVGIALHGVGKAMVQQLTQIAISEEIAWEKWAAYETVGGASPAFATLVAASRAARAGDASLIERLHAALASMGESDARTILQSLIADVVALALKTSADRLKPDLAFDSFGVDSLMSTEIQIQLDQAIGVSFSVIELLGHATINKLADKAYADIQTVAAAKKAA